MTHMKEESEKTGDVTAALLIIGNEILSGRTKDANLPHLAAALATTGIRMREVRVVPDVEIEIVEALNALRRRYDHVFTTGGIGPTHDDITAASIAVAFGVPLVRHPEAWKRLQDYYKRIGIPLNEARAKMAMTPAGATLIDNPVSAAPGFSIGNVHAMAGVPKIMQAMLAFLLPGLSGGAPVRSITILSPHPEGTIAAGLAEVQERYPPIDIGSYPSWSSTNGFRLSLVLTGSDATLLEEAASAVLALIETLGGKGMRLTEIEGG